MSVVINSYQRGRPSNDEVATVIEPSRLKKDVNSNRFSCAAVGVRRRSSRLRGLKLPSTSLAWHRPAANARCRLLHLEHRLGYSAGSITILEAVTLFRHGASTGRNGGVDHLVSFYPALAGISDSLPQIGTFTHLDCSRAAESSVDARASAGRFSAELSDA
jgi:hypothetical protein